MRPARLWLPILLLALPLSLSAASGFSFLRLPLSVRATAMGEAVAALADDISCAGYNPAGLSLIHRRTAGAGYLHYVADIQAGQLSLVQPGVARGTAGVGLCYLNSGGIVETTLDQPTGTGANFSFTSMALSLLYGRMITPQLYAGAAVKGVHERVMEYTASAAAVDLGAIYEVDLEWLSAMILRTDKPRSLGTSLALGASLQNLGTAADAFIDVKEKLPLTFRLGLAYRPFANRLTLALGGVKTADLPAKFQAGLEYWIKGTAAVRAGYNGTLADIKNGSSIDDLSGFACGLGVRYRGYTVGTAYTPFAGLGHPLRFELAAEF